jgi:oxygen-independent coproporphyrinogen III oxidase
MNTIPEYSQSWVKEYPEVDREYMETYPLTFGSIDAEQAFKKRPLHLYLHIPFCATSCSFCTFLHFDRTNSRVAAYVPELTREIELWCERDLFRNYEVKSIFFGGGTATSLSADQIGTVLTRIRSVIDVAPGAEITVEAHPNTVNAAYFDRLREFDVNRMTFGIQSFHTQHLKTMELTQTGERNRMILKAAQAAGFESLCMDLMFALPGERIDSLSQDLDTFLEYGLDGISCYRYVIDPENPMAADKKAFFRSIVPSEEEADDMYRYIVERLTGNGLVQYTQPDFAKPHKICSYTKGVWKAPQEEQLGFGAGALSYDINGFSFVNVHDLAEYSALISQGRLPILLGTRITPDEQMRKFFVLGIKCLEVDTHRFEELFGLPWQMLFHDAVRKLERLGLAQDQGRFIRLTEKGKLYVDYACKQFYSYRNQGRHQPDGLTFADLHSGSCGSHTPRVESQLVPESALAGGSRMEIA